MTPIGWPPGLALRHERMKVALQGRNIELLQLLAVIKVWAKRVRLRVMLSQDPKVQRLRPPRSVSARSFRIGSVGNRALPWLLHRHNPPTTPLGRLPTEVAD